MILDKAKFIRNKPSMAVSTQNGEVKKVKRALESWREVVVGAYEVILWQKEYYPAIILACNLLPYLLVWYYDPSFLTAVSELLLLLLFLDFMVPFAVSFLTSPDQWTADKERRLEELCRDVVNVYQGAKNCVASVQEFKSKRLVYYHVTGITLCVIGIWIGNLIPSLFLTFVLTTILLLLPGAMHKGLIKRYLGVVLLQFEKVVRMVLNKEKKQ